MCPRLPLTLRSVLELRGYQLTLILHIKLLENRDLLTLIPLQHLVKNLKHCRRGNNYLLDSLKLKLPGKYSIAARNKNGNLLLPFPTSVMTPVRIKGEHLGSSRRRLIM